MKNKKLFAIVTLVCFMFTLMPIAAFASNDGVQMLSANQASPNIAKATTPSGLKWVDHTGNISWNPVDGATRYDVVVKCDGIAVGNKQPDQGTALTVADLINQTGSYTFTVTSFGENGNRIKTSEDSLAYNYIRPAQSLTTPSNVSWQGVVPSWEPSTPTADLEYYTLHFYDEQNRGSRIGWHNVNSAENDGYVHERASKVIENVKQTYPNAEVGFCVRAVSKDVTIIANSPEEHSSNTIHTSKFMNLLAAPANPQWENNKGNVTWEPVDGAEKYDVIVFRNGTPVGNKQSMGGTALFVADSINDSGEYTFTVTAYDSFGQKGATSAKSPIYNYSRPNVALTAPGDVHWKSSQPVWQPSNPSDKVQYYTIHFRTGFTGGFVMGWDYPNAAPVDGYVSDTTPGLVTRLKDNYEDKPVLFSVRAVSSNITEIANSPVVYSYNAMNPDDNTIATVLPVPTEVKWADKTRGIVEWNAVADANGYEVLIMKDGTQVGMHSCGADFAPIAEGKYQLDVRGYFDGYGKYEVLISAKGDGENTVTGRFRVSDVYDYKRPSGGNGGGGSASSTPSQTTTSTTDSTTGTVTTTVTLSNGSAVSNTDSSVEVKVSEVENKVLNAAAKMARSDDNIQVLGDKENTISISAENKVSGAAQTSFEQPMKVTVPVDKKVLRDVKDTSKLTLAKVVTREDGTTELVYMGGSYDEATGTFNAKVNEDGDYILVEKADLVKIELTIDDTDVKHNDQASTLDVAPKINAEEGRTELPLRYLGEALGFGIEWNNNVITITKDDTAFSITIGEEIPGFGTPYIDSDRTMVSARYISEMLGANVIWDPAARQVIVVK